MKITVEGFTLACRCNSPACLLRTVLREGGRPWFIVKCDACGAEAGVPIDQIEWQIVNRSKL